jgi:DHA1 family bicyclomycin/chloramphenicol resistance-like MFS transporter
MLGLAVGQVIAGPVSDTLGRRGPVLAGLISYIATSAACAFAPTIGVLIVLRLLQGLAGGVGIVIARAIVRDLFKDALAARMFGLLMITMGVAPVCAPLIGGQVLAVTSWRGIFVVLVAVGLPLLALTWYGLPETLAPGARHGGGLRTALRGFRRLIGDRSYAPHALAFALATGTLFAYIAGAAFVLENVYGASPQLFSIAFAVNSAGLIAMSQVGAHVVGRVSAMWLLWRGLVVLALAAIASLVFTLLHTGVVPLLASLFVQVSCIGIITPNITAVALSEQEGGLGSASALLGMGQFGLGALIAPIVGVAGARNAIPMGIVIGVCGLSALAVELIYARRAAR